MLISDGNTRSRRFSKLCSMDLNDKFSALHISACYLTLMRVQTFVSRYMHFYEAIHAQTLPTILTELVV